MNEHVSTTIGLGIFVYTCFVAGGRADEAVQTQSRRAGLTALAIFCGGLALVYLITA